MIRSLFQAFINLLQPVLDIIGRGLPEWTLPVVALFLVFATLYLAGLLATHIIGRRILTWGEAVITRIPIVKTIYATVKQVVESLSLSQRKSFQKVVLVDFPSAKCRSIGFVTGTLKGADDKGFYRIFVPTSPNPTSGFIALAATEDVIEIDMSPEQAVKLIVSGGIVAPEKIPELQHPFPD